MEIYAKVVADSISGADNRITSVELQLPRSFLPQILMHRMWSRSCESLRARPTKSKLAEVTDSPFIPTFRKNKAGMVAGEELDKSLQLYAKSIWEEAAKSATKAASELAAMGVAKQTVNRLLEPFAYQKLLVTATDFADFFRLRKTDDAQPEAEELASKLKEVIDKSTPQLLLVDEWHLPYVSSRLELEHTTEDLRSICAARCARVSLCNHDGNINVAKDLSLAYTLMTSGHSNPFEHAATPATEDMRFANFYGWKSSRYLMEQHGLLTFKGGY